MSKNNTKVSVAKAKFSNLSHNKVAAGLNKKKEYKMNSNDDIFEHSMINTQEKELKYSIDYEDGFAKYGTRADFAAYQEWRALQKKNKRNKKNRRME